MNTNAKIITAVIIVAVILGIPLYFQNQRINELSDQLAQLQGTKPALLSANNTPQIVTLTRTTPSQVSAPSQPPAVVREPTADEVILKQATNNLRIIGSSAEQFMLEKGVTEASFYDLVGTGTDNYVRSVMPASDEDYSDITIAQTQTQISVSSATFGLVTFNL